eukprot:2710348-Amphidinium_carterae.2
MGYKRLQALLSWCIGARRLAVSEFIDFIQHEATVKETSLAKSCETPGPLEPPKSPKKGSSPKNRKKMGKKGVNRSENVLPGVSQALTQTPALTRCSIVGAFPFLIKCSHAI